MAGYINKGSLEAEMKVQLLTSM